ncbi:hypothetical protein L950_0231750 [Sphingobacterium sp. IITKGP-BTPF85]|nr:hypothetical protein L950_0231750 [Sphingobacterium sp. IITKGP-BTPF85]
MLSTICAPFDLGLAFPFPICTYVLLNALFWRTGYVLYKNGMGEPMTLILDHVVGGSVGGFESYHHNYCMVMKNDVTGG